MVNFSQLPNEIVSEIWGYVFEPRVENFALVSKHVYSIGRPFVEKHNKFKKRYSFFPIFTRFGVSAIKSLLKEVLYHPRIPLYITHICINPQTSDGCELDEDYISQWPSEVMALFTEAVEKSSFKPRNELSHWISKLKPGNNDSFETLMLLLSPDITTMTVINDGSSLETFLKTIQHIAKAEQLMFLARLTTVNYVCFDPNIVEVDHNLECLKTFATLPLLQSLHVTGVHIYDGFYPDGSQCFLPDSYSMTDISFTDCELDPKFLVQFLESIKGLKGFKYRTQKPEFYQFDPFLARAALLASAKQSLERLTILYPRSEEHEHLGTLRKFTALKELKTNAYLLMPYNWDNPVDVLPTSLEKLYLDTRDPRPRCLLTAITRRISGAKSKLLPNLRVLNLVVDPEDGIEHDVKKLTEECQAVGIEFELITGDIDEEATEERKKH